MTNTPIETQVECTDGPCGRSVAVVVHPIQRRVTPVIVDYKTAQRLVPIDKVLEKNGSSIRLGCSQAQLAEMDSFIETHYIQTPQPVIPVAGMLYPEYMPPLVTVDDRSSS